MLKSAVQAVRSGKLCQGTATEFAKDKSVEADSHVASGGARDAPVWNSGGDGTPPKAWQVAGGDEAGKPLAGLRQSSQSSLDAVAGAQVEDWASCPLAPERVQELAEPYLSPPKEQIRAGAGTGWVLAALTLDLGTGAETSWTPANPT